MFIGTPVLPQGLLVSNIGDTLDTMKNVACVNSVMTFSNNIVLRQYQTDYRPGILEETGTPFADTFVRTHEEFYSRTTLRQPKSPGAIGDDRDIIDELIEAAKPRNMTVYARILEPYVITGVVPGMEACAEVDANGESGPNVCYNHPDYKEWWSAIVTDLITTHPGLDGFKFGQERGGPLMKSLGGNTATCFCPHCLDLAFEQGIDVKEARQGMLALQQFYFDFHKSQDSPPPDDGFFITFMRILFRYPSLLKWERFWMDSRENQRRRIYRKIKSIRPEVSVGWHIDHGMSWDIFTRVTWDYASMTNHSDWLSIALYFDCMGPRSFNHFRNNYENLLFGDASPSLAHAMYFSMLGYDTKREPDFDSQIKDQCSLSEEYVFSETQRAVRGAAGKAKIYARIGFNVPINKMDVPPENVYKATTRALEAGADGLFLGREWDELRPENIEAFGRAVRDWQAR